MRILTQGGIALIETNHLRVEKTGEYSCNIVATIGDQHRYIGTYKSLTEAVEEIKKIAEQLNHHPNGVAVL
jgi:pterin-4a-carbinolamine dehydratase